MYTAPRPDKPVEPEAAGATAEERTAAAWAAAPALVRHAWDALGWLNAPVGPTPAVELRLAVDRVRQLGGIAFVEAADASGSIQVVCEASVLATDWGEIKALRAGDRIGVSGKPAVFGRNRTPSVQATAVRVAPRPDGASDPPLSDREQLREAFVLPRLREALTLQLRGQWFVEYEFPLLVAEGRAARFKRAELAKIGPECRVVPSPAAHLEEVVRLGQPRVFASSRSLAASRSGDADTPILTLAIADPERSELRALARTLTSAAAATGSPTSGRRFPALWATRDPTTDVVLLSADGVGDVALELVRRGTPEVGILTLFLAPLAAVAAATR